ncbi:MAG: hypothetical protein HYT09_04010 [Candidatus Levybacteria bacterium]|nr:hypothetical protein [Candidatus Levybacteria bacterium]
MPRASRKPINESINQEIKENFSSLISSLQNPQEIQQFFNDFITHEEQLMLGKRLMLHLMLERGYKSGQIESVLGINKDTVRIHRAVWERGSNSYRTVLKKIAKRAEAKLLWKKLEKILKPIDLLLKSKGNIQARAKFVSGDWD